MTTKAKILLVDDDMTLHEMYAERLRAEGYVVVSAYDGEEALSKVYSEKPEIILLDIMMPKINGIDVMKKLREDETTVKTPVILLTALVQEIDKIKSIMKPYDQYLIKSETMPAKIIDAIEKSLSVAAKGDQK
ncbi:response regulator [Candidatus Berkelbacteria bacterium CG10_big_fil_rev_8_21_14_0_10_43_13]|uniref:Response regulator n=1 Tax=Candidatus Berkelbacteria bacterium CG10_big_fil_rev_8_21_14_0_10_43_13 TaxID=1974514 RepID=A0A2H0W9G2_9BACT|nr:MAG: response regulator [Candidatus Berkelbacteria bacterium CG10_big_fil_rev_8_21_14_0_10_43_13]